MSNSNEPEGLSARSKIFVLNFLNSVVKPNREELKNFSDPEVNWLV
jgi:hypothetical protein